ncbi:MAG: hypothetical protein ACI9ND_001009, partial [Yoonia sp.]
CTTRSASGPLACPRASRSFEIWNVSSHLNSPK